MQEPVLALHLAEQRRSGIRRQDVKGGAFQAVFLDPMDGLVEDFRPIIVEAQARKLPFTWMPLS